MNIMTLADLASSDAIPVVVSNIDFPGRTLRNPSLVQQVVYVLDKHKLNITVLDTVFGSFLAAAGEFTYDDAVKNAYNGMSDDTKRSKPVFFQYENFTWRGNLIHHKWINHNSEVWTTTSIKLPNDGYLYTTQAEKFADGHRLLRDDQLHYLTNILTFTDAFFADSEVSLWCFYRVNEGRAEFKVKCEAKRAWLYITFEYGTPEGDYSKGYRKADLKKFLALAKEASQK
ncbi:hypothetical protein BC832DRAFT_565834 [Gaertneriomyces semiglobifer]|nr:hypothetical protein BC832DRAFT_565834 [Gaertneriomyces semiglobifer]